MYILTSEETKDMKGISSTDYMLPVIARIEGYIDYEDPESFILAFNKIHDSIRQAQEDVEKILDDKVQELKRDGKKYNKDQARKSIVGNIFPSILIYLFIKNKAIGNIKENIFITSKRKKKRIESFENASRINIGDEDIQTPDFDIVIYSKSNKNIFDVPDSDDDEIVDNVDKFIIFSLKTSLRERAGQTYKWKLLLEISQEKDSRIKEKYDIKYEHDQLPIVCFVTVNFYDEINNPQQRGMLKFFDKAFLAKELETFPEFISPLSEIVEYVNNEF